MNDRIRALIALTAIEYQLKSATLSPADRRTALQSRRLIRDRFPALMDRPETPNKPDRAETEVAIA